MAYMKEQKQDLSKLLDCTTSSSCPRQTRLQITGPLDKLARVTLLQILCEVLSQKFSRRRCGSRSSFDQEDGTSSAMASFELVHPLRSLSDDVGRHKGMCQD